MTHAFCPNCGFDLADVQPVKVGAFAMQTPNSSLLANGIAIHLTPAERIITHSLLTAAPDTVAHVALMERAGIDSDSNVLNVLVCRIRKRIAAAGFEAPIQSVWGVGYAWTDQSTMKGE